jgi:hypothetical protein
MSMVYDEYLLFYHRKLTCLERLYLLQFFFSSRLWRLPCSNLNRKVLQLWPITQRSRLWKSVLQYCKVHGTTSMVYTLFLLILVLSCPTQDPLLQ